MNAWWITSNQDVVEAAVVGHCKKAHCLHTEWPAAARPAPAPAPPPVRFSKSWPVRPMAPGRTVLGTPKAWIRFLRPPLSPLVTADLALLTRMYGEETAEELLVFKMKDTADKCVPGTSLKVTYTSNGGVGAFCAPDCGDNEELVVAGGNAGEGVKYVCRPIRAPPPITPIEPAAPQTPALKLNKKKKKKKKKKQKNKKETGV